MSDKVCTDEDLKWLKEADSNELIPVYKLDALLSRLEAAEWAMSELERQERKGYLHGDLVAPLEAWRKSRGIIA